MANILTSLEKTIGAGIALTILFILYYVSTGGALDSAFWSLILRYVHVLAGVMWIGLLWYFNFVQIPNMPKIPDDQKPAIGKVIAPAALFWFRWGAMATIISGLLVAHVNGYLIQAMTLGIMDGVAKHTAIGIGMWLGTIMFINVWFVIWPNQKRALGMVESDPETKAASVIKDYKNIEMLEKKMNNRKLSEIKSN